MNTTFPSLTKALAFAFLTAGFAHASVVLNIGPTVSADFNATGAAALSFSTVAANNSILVVGTTTKGIGSSSVANDSVDGISFNGQSFTRIAGGVESHREAQIWYLDLGNTGVVNDTITTTFSSTTSLGTFYGNFFAYQISNATVTGAVGNGGGLQSTAVQADLAGLDAGSFVVDVVLENYNGQASTLASTGSTRTGASAIESVPDALSGGHYALTSYITNFAGGDADLNYTVAASQRLAMASAAFAAIPEPSTVALSLLASILLLKLSKRRRS